MTARKSAVVIFVWLIGLFNCEKRTGSADLEKSFVLFGREKSRWTQSLWDNYKV